MRIEQKLILPLVLISIGNTITGIIKSQGISYYFLYVGIFVLIIPVLYFIKLNIKEKTLSFALILFSILSISLNDLSVLNDAFFVSCAVIIFAHKKPVYIIYSILYLSILMVRYSFEGFAASEIITHLSGFSFVAIIFQHFIYPIINNKSEPEPILKVNPSLEVKKVVAEIVQLKCMGYDWPDINDKLSLCVTDDRVRKIVTEERNRLGFPSQESFVSWLHVSGIISPVPDKLRIQA